MLTCKKIAAIEGFVNLAVVALIIFSIVIAFAVEMPALEASYEGKEGFDALGLGIAIALGSIGSVASGITGLMILASALGLVLCKAKFKAWSIVGTVGKFLSLITVAFVACMSVTPIGAIVFISAEVLLLTTAVYGIVACVQRKRAFM